MKLTNAATCEECQLVVEPDKHGRCPHCKGDALVWLTKILEGKVVFETPDYTIAALERMYTL